MFNKNEQVGTSLLLYILYRHTIPIYGEVGGMDVTNLNWIILWNNIIWKAILSKNGQLFLTDNN